MEQQQYETRTKVDAIQLTNDNSDDVLKLVRELLPGKWTLKNDGLTRVGPEGKFSRYKVGTWFVVELVEVKAGLPIFKARNITDEQFQALFVEVK